MSIENIENLEGQPSDFKLGIVAGIKISVSHFLIPLKRSLGDQTIEIISEKTITYLLDNFKDVK